LPAHSSVTVTVAAGSLRISSTESDSGELTSPPTFNAHAAASTCGIGRCERT
jgi:hypothetical protein